MVALVAEESVVADCTNCCSLLDSDRISKDGKDEGQLAGMLYWGSRCGTWWQWVRLRLRLTVLREVGEGIDLTILTRLVSCDRLVGWFQVSVGIPCLLLSLLLTTTGPMPKRTTVSSISTFRSVFLPSNACCIRPSLGPTMSV